MEKIAWTDFDKIDIRSGRIKKVKIFEKAHKPAYQLWIDFGQDLGVLQSSAQITELYNMIDLPGKMVIAVVNFPVKQIANFMSECLVLGLKGKEGVVLLSPDFEIEPGIRLS